MPKLTDGSILSSKFTSWNLFKGDGGKKVHLLEELYLKYYQLSISIFCQFIPLHFRGKYCTY